METYLPISDPHFCMRTRNNFALEPNTILVGGNGILKVGLSIVLVDLSPNFNRDTIEQITFNRIELKRWDRSRFLRVANQFQTNDGELYLLSDNFHFLQFLGNFLTFLWNFPCNQKRRVWGAKTLKMCNQLS